MKVSLNWLRRHVDLPESAEEVAKALTAVGLEVGKKFQLVAYTNGSTITFDYEGIIATNVLNAPLLYQNKIIITFVTRSTAACFPPFFCVSFLY